MVGTSKRFIMTLYSGSADIESHRTRIVLSEKGIPAEVIEVERYEAKKEDFRELNPHESLPTLIDRDLVLYHARIIIEYLDERFPHPPLLPVYPITRAKSRLSIHRIEQDWYPLAHRIEKGSDKEAAKARKDLLDSLVSAAPIFKEFPYFLSEEFSLIDCSLAPLLWRLPALKITLPKQAKPIMDYAERLFQREAFKSSLTEAETELRLGITQEKEAGNS